MAKGSCLCGAVQYRVDGDLRPVIACHCLQCRKTSGHFVAATACKTSDLSVEGDVTWYASSATARRGFCATCGSNLFWDSAPGLISIFAGTLDGATNLRIGGHIYCGAKGDYYDIADGAPQAEGPDLTLTELE